MGIFSRLFGGGPDGDPPDGEQPSGEVVEAAIVAPTEEPPASAPAPAPVRVPAGSEPTPLPKVEPNMWAWPARGKQPEPEPKRAPKPQAVIVESGPVVIEATQPPRDATLVSSPPPAIEASQKLRDPTLVMSPPPPAPVATPATPPSPPPAPVVATPAAPIVAPARANLPPPKRGKVDTINSAFDSIVARRGTKQGDGVSTAADLAEVKETFEQVAAVHVAQVRDVMLELRYGGEPAWLEAARPALHSVRKMAAQMELAELVAALDAFCAALDDAVRTHLADKTKLIAAYQRLIELVPMAFELSAEHDRREPIIVEALLLQVSGVERPTIDRLAAAGLGKLSTLLAANAGDLAAVTGLHAELAQAIVERFRAYRASGSTLAAVDSASERKQLHDLVIVLSLQNDDFRRVASSWAPTEVAKKRELRRAREQTFQKVRVALARLGEREHLQRLDKLPFDDRIAMLDKLISAQLGG